MSKPKMTLAELATALGLARSTVAALKAKGMPCDNVESARAWRATHVDAALRKDARMNREDAAARVSRMGDDLLRDLEHLRTEFMALPKQAQARVTLHFAVWDMLVAPHLEPLEPHL